MIETITSRDNPKIRRCAKLQSSKAYRERERLFCCEGEKLLREALQSGIPVEQVFLSDALPHAESLALAPHSYVVPQRLMEHISGVETPQGVLFVCRMRPAEQALPEGPCLVLEDVRDPGNVGTAVRTAEAFQVPLVLTGGCADLYNPKTIRSTMGSIFRAQVLRLTREQLWQQWEAQGRVAYAAALSPRALDIRQADLRDAAVVVGNEARGVSDEMKAHCQGEIIIPIQGAESLNAGVAAALVMWEIRRSASPAGEAAAF